jgi:Flp pilus assembly protein TadG
MSICQQLRSFARREDGGAVIEITFIFPLMVIMFFGFIDTSLLLSDGRRVHYAAQVVGNDVIRLQSPTTSAEVQDAFSAAAITMRAALANNARVEVYVYQRSGTSPVLRWDMNNGVGAPCGQPNVTSLNNLMADGNDVVISVVCVGHTSAVGQMEFPLRRQIMMRPRTGSFLECPDC